MKIESITDVAQRLLDAIERYKSYNEGFSVELESIKTELDELKAWVKGGILEKRITN